MGVESFRRNEKNGTPRAEIRARTNEFVPQIATVEIVQLVAPLEGVQPPTLHALQSGGGYGSDGRPTGGGDRGPLTFKRIVGAFLGVLTLRLALQELPAIFSAEFAAGGSTFFVGTAVTIVGIVVGGIVSYYLLFK